MKKLITFRTLKNNCWHIDRPALRDNVHHCEHPKYKNVTVNISCRESNCPVWKKLKEAL
jgi:hypothetical protein